MWHRQNYTYWHPLQNVFSIIFETGAGEQYQKKTFGCRNIFGTFRLDKIRHDQVWDFNSKINHSKLCLTVIYQWPTWIEIKSHGPIFPNLFVLLITLKNPFCNLFHTIPADKLAYLLWFTQSLFCCPCLIDAKTYSQFPCPFVFSSTNFSVPHHTEE